MTVARIPFSLDEESVLRQLAGWMLFISIIHFIAALGTLGFGCFGFATGGMFAMVSTTMLLYGVAFLVIGAGTAIVLCLQGVLLLQARGSFVAVVQSDDADQANLMEGLRKLKLFFGVEVAFIALGLIGSLIKLGLSIVGALS